MSKTMHVTVSIKGLQARLNASRPHSTHGLWKVLQDENGRFLTMEEHQIEVDKYRRKGFEVIPTCDKFDEKGHCRGHKQKE
jgi:hypothetical protein